MARLENALWLAARTGPRLAFGNDASVPDNLAARAEWRRLRLKQAAVSSSPWGEETGRTLKRRGWVQLPAFPREVMERILAGYYDHIERAESTHDMGPRDRSAVRYVVDPLHRVPELRALVNDEVKDCLTAYYRTDFRLLHARMWRISSLPEHERLRDNYGNLWHCDHHRITMLKVFIQISEDVSAQNGALRMYDIRTTKSVMRRGYISQGKQVSWAARRLRDDRGMTAFDGQPGSAIAVNANLCLHRAGVPLPGRTRGMVQLTFDIADHPPMDGDYFTDLAPDTNVVEGRPV